MKALLKKLKLIWEGFVKQQGIAVLALIVGFFGGYPEVRSCINAKPKMVYFVSSGGHGTAIWQGRHIPFIWLHGSLTNESITTQLKLRELRFEYLYNGEWERLYTYYPIPEDIKSNVLKNKPPHIDLDFDSYVWPTRRSISSNDIFDFYCFLIARDLTLTIRQAEILNSIPFNEVELKIIGIDVNGTEYEQEFNPVEEQYYSEP